MGNFFTGVLASVRRAIKRPVLTNLATRALRVAVESEAERKSQAASVQLPQPLRLLLIAQARARAGIRKHRRGDSAKSPANYRRAGYGPGEPCRRVRCTNPLTSYDAFKAEQAAQRAAKRAAVNA